MTSEGTESGNVQSGSTFGGPEDLFQLGEEIGSGAAARVYACRRMSTNEEFACKVINLQKLRLLGDFDSQMNKLDREVGILTQLSHPRIVRLERVYRTSQNVFIVMEYVRGGELFDAIVRKKSLNEEEALHIFRQLLEGLSYMHFQSVIHRDLKPENILIASSRQTEKGILHEVKIADFGLSKMISQETSMAKTFVGTPQYWAPEVLATQGGTGTYTQACDFWSLGAVLYVMLAGRYPFDGKKMPLQEQIRTASFSLEGPAWKNVSENAKNVVRGLLQVDPAKRLTQSDCQSHPWVYSKGLPPPPPRALSPGLGRTVSMGQTRIIEVSPTAPCQTSTAVPIVQQPSNASASDVSHVSRCCSSVEEVASPPKLASQDEPKPEAARKPGYTNLEKEILPHESIFCLNELLKLQVSIAGSLEMAALAFRHADPELAESIQNTFWQSRELAAAASNVVNKYAQVAQAVSTEILPDLDLAIQEKEPSLATNLLGMVKNWVADMKKHGEGVKARYHVLQESVHKLIQRAQRSKMGNDRRLMEAMDAFLPNSPGTGHRPAALEDSGWRPTAVAEGTPRNPRESPNASPPAQFENMGAVSFSPATAPVPHDMTVSLPPVDWSRQLFEQLRRIQVGSSAHGPAAIEDQDMEPRNSTSGQRGGSKEETNPSQITARDTEAWKQDVLELLFMTPGYLPPPSSSTLTPKVESVGNFVESQGPCSRIREEEPSDAAEQADVQMGGTGDSTPSQGSTARPAGLSDASDLGVNNKSTSNTNNHNNINGNSNNHNNSNGTPVMTGRTASTVEELGEMEPDDQVVRYVAAVPSPSAVEAMSHSSGSLLRALRELKRVDQILEGCTAFWSNMDGTVERLQQMKDHTEQLVSVASKSKALKDKFDERLAAYTDFWASLERLCRQYCADHQVSSKRMYEVIREVSEAADVIDTNRALQFSVMREQPRRHGY